MGRILLIFVLVVVGVILIDRLALWAESRGWIYCGAVDPGPVLRPSKR